MTLISRLLLKCAADSYLCSRFPSPVHMHIYHTIFTQYHPNAMICDKLEKCIAYLMCVPFCIPPQHPEILTNVNNSTKMPIALKSQTHKSEPIALICIFSVNWMNFGVLFNASWLRRRTFNSKRLAKSAHTQQSIATAFVSPQIVWFGSFKCVFFSSSLACKSLLLASWFDFFGLLIFDRLVS